MIVNGEEGSVAYFAEKHGLSPACIDARLRRGWSPERAVLTPKARYVRREVGRPHWIFTQPWVPA